MFDYDRLVECAYGDSCSVEEMERMMQGMYETSTKKYASYWWMVDSLAFYYFNQPQELQKMELDTSKVGYGAFLTVEPQEDAVANALLTQALEIQVEDARSNEEQEESQTCLSQQYSSTEDIQHLIHQMRDIAEHEEHWRCESIY